MCSTPIDREHFSIGEIAKEFGVTLRALRYYEHHGLLDPIRDRKQRLYTSKDRELLAKIIKAKKFGFSLREIRALMHPDMNNTQGAVLQLSREQIVEQIELLNRRKKEVEAALADLRKMVADFDEAREPR